MVKFNDQRDEDRHNIAMEYFRTLYNLREMVSMAEYKRATAEEIAIRCTELYGEHPEVWPYRFSEYVEALKFEAEREYMSAHIRLSEHEKILQAVGLTPEEADTTHRLFDDPDEEHYRRDDEIYWIAGAEPKLGDYLLSFKSNADAENKLIVYCAADVEYGDNEYGAEVIELEEGYNAASALRDCTCAVLCGSREDAQKQVNEWNAAHQDNGCLRRDWIGKPLDEMVDPVVG